MVTGAGLCCDIKGTDVGDSGKRRRATMNPRVDIVDAYRKSVSGNAKTGARKSKSFGRRPKENQQCRLT